jgi:multidrug resistance efflux pump
MAGQVVATMDIRDLEASLKKSQALVSQVERALEEARAKLAIQRALSSPKALPQLKPSTSGGSR